jgi:glutamyl-tRNA synthetase
VIVRSDGKPVFHLVNVVDDLDMAITHVIRGEDHLSNTPKHIALFRAFGVPPPHYAHIPLILNADGSKMSKRDEGASLSNYIEEGYVPEALVNYLCLLGWSPKDNREILSREEIIDRFDLPQVLRHNARFDLAKLHWMNAEYMRELSDDRFHELGVHALGKAGIDTNRFDLDYVKAALDTCRGKLKTFAELPGYAGFYFSEVADYDPDALKQDFVPENKPRLERLRAELAKLEDFTAPHIEALLKNLAGELNVRVGVLVHPTRLACTGQKIGPSLYHLIEVLGRDRVVERLARALSRM